MEKNNATIGLVSMAFIYIVLLTLLTTRIIPYENRFLVLTIMGALVVGYSLIMKRSWKNLGFRLDNLKDSALINAIFSLVVVVLAILVVKTDLFKATPIKIDLIWYAAYLLLYSPLQEFIFRSFLINELKVAGVASKFWVIFIPTLTFGLLHIFYLNWITLALATLLGLFLTMIYRLKPNFIAIAATHCVIGIVTIYLGII